VPLSSRPWSTGASGTWCVREAAAAGWPGRLATVLASSRPWPSTTVMAWRRVTSEGTKNRSRASMAYSATTTPAKPSRSISGTWTWNTGEPKPSWKARE
jgi:hypothetical protein